MADATRRKKRCGNDAPWKAGKTQQPSFPLFPPRLEIRPKTPASHLSTAPAARFHLKETEEENMKPKQNST